MMPIHISGKKIKNRHIHQIQESTALIVRRYIANLEIDEYLKGIFYNKSEFIRSLIVFKAWFISENC